MEKSKVKKLAIAGILIALGVVCSTFSIPVGASRCFPVQHMVNVLAAVILGPYYGVAMAAITSLIRVAVGTGTFLAFPGSMATRCFCPPESMCGALAAGLIYKYTKRMYAAALGELFGTSIVGGILCYPVAVLFMKQEAALFSYVIPFFVSSLGGSIAAYLALTALNKTGALKRLV